MSTASPIQVHIYVSVSIDKLKIMEVHACCVWKRANDMQFKDISMHRRAVAAVVHSECMSATYACFIQVHMCQH